MNVPPGAAGEDQTRPTPQGDGGLDWRFASPPQWVESVSAMEASNTVTKLSHTDKDAGDLIIPALRLPREEAARVLTNYLRRYEEKNTKAGPAWGRAVFCLGLAQSETAKQRLFELWNKHDRQLTQRKSKIELKEELSTVPPLRVIGDALGFYLDDPAVRTWFVERIKEAQEIDDSDRSSPAFIRRRDREQLLVYLYRWDLIDSVDGGQTVTPARLRSWHTFTSASVTNIALSAHRYVEWVKQLSPLDLAGDEQDWIRRRQRDPRVHVLSSTAMRLGRDLSFVLWRDYLKPPGTVADAGVRAELWATATWTWPHYLNRHEIGAWTPSADESAFLADAIAYFKRLPDGYYKHLFASYLWTMACFAADPSDNREITQIRDVVGVHLTSTEKEVLIARTKQLQRLYKAALRSPQENRR